MKNFLVFISGFIAGILAILLFEFFFSNSKQLNDGLVGLNIFPQKGECLTIKKQIEIFQVIKPNVALAETGEYPDRIMILLINYDNKSYYDDQKIEVPDKKCARQIGTYQYTTNSGIDKTVPAVVIE